MSEANENYLAVKEQLVSVTEDGNRAEPSGEDLAGSGNVDKIRDILFGTQMRDYEKRFARLEERLLKESGDLREEMKRRFEALESYLKQELEALTDRLKAEQDERAASIDKTTGELRSLAQTVDKRAAQLDEQASKSQRELRQQLLDQSKTLSDEIRQKYAELSAVMHRELAGLSNDKTDRATLAALFTEVALRLNNEFKIPGSE